MNKIKVLLLLLYFNYSPLQAQYHYTLSGVNCESINGETVYLIRSNVDGVEQRDSTVVKKGNFTLTGIMDVPCQEAYIKLKFSPNSYFSFVIDSGFNQLSVENTHTKNKLGKAKIKLTESNIIFNKTTNFLKKISETKLYPNTTAYDSFKRAIRLQDLSVVKEYPNNYYSLIHLNELSYYVASLFSEEIMMAYNSLSEDIKQTDLGKALQERLLNSQKTEEGKIFPDVECIDTLGQNVHIKNYRNKLSLIAFSAPWCVPCKKKIPDLKLWHQKYSTKGLNIIYINMDDDSRKWKKMIHDYAMPWINISDTQKFKKSSIAKNLNITAIPFYLIVDENFKILYNPFQRQDRYYSILETVIRENIEIK